MSRKEFLERLDMLLCDIPEEERAEAVRYYVDYFDDAGAENEAKVIKELESPEKVAAIIRAGMGPGEDEYSEYSETGYTDTRFEERKVPKRRGGASERTESASDSGAEHAEEDILDGQYSYASSDHGEQHYEEKKEPWTSNILKIILVIAIIAVALPVGGSFVTGIIALIFGLIVAFAGIFIGLIIAGVAIAASGIAVLSVAMVKLFSLQPGGIIMLGTGLVLLALGVLLTVLMVKATGIVFPAVFRGVVELVRKPFGKKAKGGA